jgi:hypothetical protein
MTEPTAETPKVEPPAVKPPAPPSVLPLWLAVVAVAGLAAWPLVDRKTPDDRRVAALEARLDAAPKPETDALKSRLDDAASGLRVLAERLARLESAGASKDALGKIEEGQDALIAETKSLAARLAKGAAEDQAAIARLAEALDRLERRLVIAEARIEAGASAPATLALGFGQLREALRRSGPYVEELDRFRALAKDDAALRAAADALAARAREGAASLDELRGRFADVARSAVRHTARGTDGLWDALIERLSSVVVIRRVGEVAGETAEALIARAETRLAAGDLAQAAALVERLSGAAAEAASSWLGAARARLEVERALAEIEARVAERLGKAAGRP